MAALWSFLNSLRSFERIPARNSNIGFATADKEVRFSSGVTNMSSSTTSNIVPTQQYSLADILQYTEPKQPGTFRRILGSLAGGAANAFVPGIGTLIGNVIGG